MKLLSCEGAKKEPKNVVKNGDDYICNDVRRDDCRHYILYSSDEGDKNLCGYFHDRDGIPDTTTIVHIDEWKTPNEIKL